MVKAWQVLIGVGAVGVAGYLVWRYVLPEAIPGARLSATSISCDPSSIAVGSPTTISVNVKNDGDAAGSGTVGITANGTEIGRVTTPSVAAGGTGTVTASWTPTSEGSYNICAEVIA